MVVTRFINCRLFRDGHIIVDDLWVENGKIINPRDQFFSVRKPADRVVDCGGCLIAPGFIDIQINGGYGVDFSSFDDPATVETGVTTLARKLLRHGVIGFLPTIITSQPDTYHRILPKLRITAGSRDSGAAVFGVHLEGPFINPSKKGAHPKELIRTGYEGIDDFLSVYGGLDNVRMLTLAPEFAGESRVIEELKQRGITVSIGHSQASIQDAERACHAGATCITHLFNAMTAFHHRDPGIVGLLPFAHEGKYEVFYGMIVDGWHTHEASVKFAHSMHPAGCVLITDATAAMGLDPGHHRLGEVDVTLHAGQRLTVSGTDTLAGSAATMDACVRNFAKLLGVERALECASLHPAQALGIDAHKGHLGYGADADFVLLDTDLHCVATYIAGERVWSVQDV